VGKDDREREVPGNLWVESDGANDPILLRPRGSHSDRKSSTGVGTKTDPEEKKKHKQKKKRKKKKKKKKCRGGGLTKMGPFTLPEVKMQGKEEKTNVSSQVPPVR